MKKVILVVLLISVIFIIGFFIFSNNNLSNIGIKNNTDALDKTYESSINEITKSDNENPEVNSKDSKNEIKQKSQQEIEISTFSTNVSGDSNRLSNIKLTCNKINGFILDSGKTFSFNDVVGDPTQEAGYKEADVFVGTKIEKDFGGGNCQVSTTLYNAALGVDFFEIIERNPHKKKVPYIEEGKDAAVSFGLLDLKFKNNSDKKLKIYMTSDDQKLTARIVELSDIN